MEDNESLNIWDNWEGNWRDVFILDRQNEVYAIYNLTEHNLAPGKGICSDETSTTEASCLDSGATWTENYDILKELFITAATQ